MTRLEFGTAGLRAVLGPEPDQMNEDNVARATAGLCAYLIAKVPDARSRGLCLGRDGRHMSRQFAEVTAQVAWGAGFHVHLFDELAPTPLVAFAIRQCGAAGGVVITASHNPREYNGYKVYFEHGAQIVPPQDAEISALIDAVDEIPRLGRGEAEGQGLLTVLGPALRRGYVETAASAIGNDSPGPLRIAYTALHGVGQPLALEALAMAGFDNVHAVATQAEPDPDFPTVAFPNPEEPGAMDAVLALAQQVNADLALANDPDADRLAVAARDGDGDLVTWTGNELGALLLDRIAASTGGDRRAALASIVSTPLVADIAAAHGVHFEWTLTGFKWIEHRAIALEAEGLRCILGFEEALGYAVSAAVRDKDGISAAVAIARIAAKAVSDGRCLPDLLDDLWLRHGVHRSAQHSIRLSGGDEQRDRLMGRARQSTPGALAGLTLESSRDLLRDDVLPPSDVLIWHFAQGARICVRPSGTEPKVKIYVDVKHQVDGGDLAAAKSAADRTLRALLDAAVDHLAGD